MSHEQQTDFCRRIRAMRPEFFKDVLVLDVGSLDINGSNRFLFKNCLYIGLDLGPGRNVDVVSPVHKLGLPDATFDTIVSTECFEHDMHWDKSLGNIVRMLKPGGLLLFTCATTGRPEHGTRRTTPQDAPLLQDTEQWNEYYRNLESRDIRSAIDVDAIFSSYSFEIGEQTCDLYFWGVKAGHLDRRDNYSFLVAQDSSPPDVEPLVDAHAIGRFVTRLKAEWSESVTRSQEEVLAVVGARAVSHLSSLDSSISQRLEERNRTQDRNAKELVYRIEGLSSRLTHSLKKIQAIEQALGKTYASVQAIEQALGNTYTSVKSVLDDSSWSAERLLELWDEAFIEGSYRAILGRSPGTEDGEHFLALVRNGECREEVSALDCA